ncbi:hypothetical protein OGAPHI_003367 [Ogataea philodendri]|uniref:Uncharacterized protein n=1 Tax=Ogataea philodendri TaxID=1378263 RepID=A0A9P8P7S6_9ASCO|nr:uncharacterized protein OGAPHI_003367 [Ogataea philodendri]KAH3666917.1 hypothetical protein OGAPHI_003367 [Ogataea philodendri]
MSKRCLNNGEIVMDIRLISGTYNLDSSGDLPKNGINKYVSNNSDLEEFGLFRTNRTTSTNWPYVSSIDGLTTKFVESKSRMVRKFISANNAGYLTVLFMRTCKMSYFTNKSMFVRRKLNDCTIMAVSLRIVLLVSSNKIDRNSGKLGSILIFSLSLPKTHCLTVSIRSILSRMDSVSNETNKDIPVIS